jgi:hypothetical protein
MTGSSSFHIGAIACNHHSRHTIESPPQIYSQIQYSTLEGFRRYYQVQLCKLENHLNGEERSSTDDSRFVQL